MFLKLFLAICICGAIYGLNKKCVFSGLFDSDSVKSQANKESNETKLANKRKDKSYYYLTEEDINALDKLTQNVIKKVNKGGTSIKTFTTPSGQIIKVNVKKTITGYCQKTKTPNYVITTKYDRPIMQVDF